MSRLRVRALQWLSFLRLLICYYTLFYIMLYKMILFPLLIFFLFTCLLLSSFILLGMLFFFFLFFQFLYFPNWITFYWIYFLSDIPYMPVFYMYENKKCTFSFLNWSCDFHQVYLLSFVLGQSLFSLSISMCKFWLLSRHMPPKAYI